MFYTSLLIATTTENPYLKKIITALQDYWQSLNFKADRRVTLTQPYRAVGSLSKNGHKIKGYLVGKKYTIEMLAEILNIQLWFQNNACTRQTFDSGFKKVTVGKSPNANMAFYKHCLKRIFFEVTEGFRYTALFALAIVAYKCRVSNEKMQMDIRTCAEIFNERCSLNNQIEENELQKAFKGFSEKFLLVNSTKLEEWFGFKFPRKSKNSKRKRKEHLEYVHKIRQEKKQQKAEKISQLIKQNYSKKEIAEIMGMSLQNLYATYKKLFPKAEI